MISRAVAAMGLVPALLLVTSGTADAAPTAEPPSQEVWAELTFRDWPGRWVAGTITDGVSKSSVVPSR